MTTITIKRALLSVADKTGLIDFAKGLIAQNVEIISTGGTSEQLHAAGIAHQCVEDITGFPEIMGGRVKTLHPKIHGAILGKRDKHTAEAQQHGLTWIDLVVVNFYPFAATIRKPGVTWEQAIENIDIGGPTLVRAAAKNCAWVGVIVDPADYPAVLSELAEQGLQEKTRRNLAAKAFALTSQYDAMIQHYFLEQAESAPPDLQLQCEKWGELRYGENPHQKATAYRFQNKAAGLFSAEQHQGKPLSYNNMLDAEAAWQCVSEFTDPAAVIVKHANPCGAASATTITAAFERALAADPQSAFGGIVALNRPCNKEVAEAISAIFMEVIIAPAFSEEALQLFSKKPNLRILTLAPETHTNWEMRFITGGLLCQERDKQALALEDLKVVTQAQPPAADFAAMTFAWRVLKHIKSNAILIARAQETVGIGAGQVSRIDAVEIALHKAGKRAEQAILASDAFFPFRDSIDRIAKTGIRTIIQPGGSVRDEEVIAACNEHGISMVFTGKRCFKH